jgi:hypothetical protein
MRLEKTSLGDTGLRTTDPLARIAIGLPKTSTSLSSRLWLGFEEGAIIRTWWPILVKLSRSREM